MKNKYNIGDKVFVGGKSPATVVWCLRNSEGILYEVRYDERGPDGEVLQTTVAEDELFTELCVNNEEERETRSITVHRCGSPTGLVVYLTESKYREACDSLADSADGWWHVGTWMFRRSSIDAIHFE